MRLISPALVAVALGLFEVSVSAQGASLRVCSDPNNLPFSDRAGNGFENRIAEIVARDLGLRVAYTFAAEHENFVKHTLDARKCDVIIGVPVGDDEVEETRPYYASSYVFVTRRASNLDVTSLADARLRRLKIGVDLIAGDDEPPEVALGEEGIVDNVSGYLISAERDRPEPGGRLFAALAQRDVDIAAAWGPLAGFYAKRSPVPLTVVPIVATERFAPLRFQFAIAMGVRKGDDGLSSRLDSAIARRRAAIAAVLRRYGVPLLTLGGGIDG